MTESLRDQLARAADVLARAGVDSPRADVELLAAHLIGVSRGVVGARVIAGDSAIAGLETLVEQRARRVPLQHLTGKASFRRCDLSVGPGVFVPRPETELVAGEAIHRALHVVSFGEVPVVVDLCTGSGAIAMAVADEVPDAVVIAVERDVDAYRWAERNLVNTGIQLHQADASTALPHLNDCVHVVVSNPPYIPPGAVPVDPEVMLHDPDIALYGGGVDGLEVPRAVVASAERLLRKGGTLVMEHAATQQDAVMQFLVARGWVDLVGKNDLAGKPRYVIAVWGEKN